MPRPACLPSPPFPSATAFYIGRLHLPAPYFEIRAIVNTRRVVKGAFPMIPAYFVILKEEESMHLLQFLDVFSKYEKSFTMSTFYPIFHIS
jgi:hypothetical protein